LDILGVAVAENFVNDVSQAEVLIGGYKVYCKDRCHIRGGKGGGVILYIRNNVVSYDCGYKLGQHIAFCYLFFQVFLKTAGVGGKCCMNS